MISLTESQIREFQAQGYLVVRHLISPEQVEELRADYERALRGEIAVPQFEGRKKAGPMVQLSCPSQHIPGWQQHPYFLNALAIARQLLGDDLQYAYDQIIYKPPHIESVTHWHQDAGYWESVGEGQRRALTCWLALSPATLENGCMQFIPGSHKDGVQEHFSLAGQSEINEALATHADASRAVACPLEPGDASFHHSRILHYTGGNLSDIPRYGLITHFFSP
jgi:ectoine hydroxylase-related dioxygenase (phytanoyl-CoA dioxygenase family)